MTTLAELAATSAAPVADAVVTIEVHLPDAYLRINGLGLYEVSVSRGRTGRAFPTTVGVGVTMEDAVLAAQRKIWSL
jgi:hypothetical protein